MNTFKHTKYIMVLFSGECQKMSRGQTSFINVLRIVCNHTVKFTVTSTCVLDLVPGSFPQDFSPSIIRSPFSLFNFFFTEYFPMTYTHILKHVNYFPIKLEKKLNINNNMK